MSVPLPNPNQLDQRINPIEAFIYKGLADRFYQVFGAVLTYTTSQDKKAARAKMLGNKDTGYPMAFAVLKTIAVDETRYSPKSLLLRGVTSGASSDSKLTYKAQFVPVVISFEITFLSQDIKEVTALAKEWIFASIGGYLKFSVSYGVVDLDIGNDLDREVQIPEKKAGLSDVNEYEMITNMRVLGYLSPDNLSKVQAVTDLKIQGLMGPQADYEALKNATQGHNGQIFMFNRQWNSIPGPEGSYQDPKTPGA
jgi:hypothetical protein